MGASVPVRAKCHLNAAVDLASDGREGLQRQGVLRGILAEGAAIGDSALSTLSDPQNSAHSVVHWSVTVTDVGDQTEPCPHVQVSQEGTKQSTIPGGKEKAPGHAPL